MYKYYKGKHKLTCRQCEYRWWRNILKFMVRERKLTPIERMSSRVGYMGAGFLMAGQWTVEPILFIIGFYLFTNLFREIFLKFLMNINSRQMSPSKFNKKSQYSIIFYENACN